jgi:uncharacterized membrane protein
VNDLQENYPNINLIEKYRYNLMENQHIFNPHFDHAKLNEKLEKEVKASTKKEVKVIEENGYLILNMTF